MAERERNQSGEHLRSEATLETALRESEMSEKFESRRRWSQKSDALLKQLRDLGTPTSEVALRMGRTVGAVYLRYEKLGLSLSHDERLARARAAKGVHEWTLEEDQLLVMLREEGETFRAIGQRLGLHGASVHQRLKTLERNGVLVARDLPGGRKTAPRKPRPWDDESDRLLMKLRRDGLSFPQIAARIGRSTGSVYQRLQLLVSRVTRQ